MTTFVFRCLSWFVILPLSATQFESPPVIYSGPPKHSTYTDSTLPPEIIPCYATGQPYPTFKWLLDGKVIDGETNQELSVSHNSKPGYYQCRATNKLGTAVSDVVQVIAAEQAAFSQATHVTLVNGTIGDKLRLRCRYTRPGVPTPRTESFSWRRKDGMNQPSLGKRVQIDEAGNMHFAALTVPDFDAVRTCHISNRILNIDVGGSDSKIVYSNQPEVSPTKPALMFYSNITATSAAQGNTTVVGLEGQNVSMRCFFSGSGDIEYKWDREGGVKLDRERTEYPKASTELLIKNVQKSDSAVYICEATNGQGSQTFRTQLLVYAAPSFRSLEDKPQNVNRSVGDTVEFKCNPFADPPADITWYKNGIPIDPKTVKTDPKFVKFSLSDDLKTLSIENLCKNNCVKGADADIMVIQCNASNRFGYAFSNGYVNVFERTVFTSKPPSEFILESGKTLSLSAHAQTDRMTPLRYEWYRDERLLFDDESRVRITFPDDGSSNLTISDTNEHDYGIYKCRITNGISSDEAVTEVKPPPAVADTWPILLALILLLIIFLLIAIILAIGCFIYQNRGEDYPVDETERKQGNNPEQDLEDSGFHPFQRIHSGSDAGSTISRSSLERLDKRIDEETGLIRDRSGSLGGTFK